jgi:hypothetical protein
MGIGSLKHGFFASGMGSTPYVVYTRAQVPTTVLGPTDVGVGHAPTSDAVLVKESFWWGP